MSAFELSPSSPEVKRQECDTWTPERVRELIRLVNLDPPLSSAEIARRLNVSKNTIIGKCSRLELTLPLAKQLFAPCEPTPDFFNGGGCLWPLGHPGEPGFHFCGHHELAVTESGKRRPYCKTHSAIAYRQLGESEGHQ